LLTPKLASGWLALMTPLYSRVGRHILEGMRNDTVVTGDAGRGWLQFELNPLAGEQTRIGQTALWDPVGLYERLYRYSLWPMHELILRAMIRGIARESGCPRPVVKRRRSEPR